MKQLELYKIMLEKQEARIKEMENLIFILEEQNNLKDQLIDSLREEIQVQEKYIQKYSDAIKQMMEDIQ